MSFLSYVLPCPHTLEGWRSEVSEGRSLSLANSTKQYTTNPISSRTKSWERERPPRCVATPQRTERQAGRAHYNPSPDPLPPCRHPCPCRLPGLGEHLPPPPSQTPMLPGRRPDAVAEAEA